MTEDKLNHRLHLRAGDFIEQAAQRGEELNEKIAFARAVQEYNRNPKRWMQEWDKTEKKVRLF
jgi:hypothetical protein